MIENVRFVQSQMWTMTVIHARNVLLENIYVNSTDVSPVGFEFSSLNVSLLEIHWLIRKYVDEIFRLMARILYTRIISLSVGGQ